MSGERPVLCAQIRLHLLMAGLPLPTVTAERNDNEYLVTFNAPIRDWWRERIEALGLKPFITDGRRVWVEGWAKPNKSIEVEPVFKGGWFRQKSIPYQWGDVMNIQVTNWQARQFQARPRLHVLKPAVEPDGYLTSAQANHLYLTITDIIRADLGVKDTGIAIMDAIITLVDDSAERVA